MRTGTLVTVTAATAPPGTHFVGWSGDVPYPREPIYTHDDGDDSVHGGDDYRDLYSTSDESHSRTWPRDACRTSSEIHFETSRSLGGVVLQCTNKSRPSRGITHRCGYVPW